MHKNMFENEGFQCGLKTCEHPAFMTFIKPCRNVLEGCPGALIMMHGGDIGRGNNVLVCICEQGPSVIITI